MKPELKSIWSDSVNIDSFAPDDPKNFWLLLGMLIGVEGVDGGEYFELNVCTPNALNNLVKSEGAQWGRGLMVVEEFNFGVIVDKVNEIILSGHFQS